jgi:hypothetical protein
MTGRLAVSRHQKPAVSYRMSVEQAAVILVETRGNAQAQRQAWREQQNARRARSRKRFSFWLRVESEIKKQPPHASVE